MSEYTFRFVPSKSMKIAVLPEQEKQLSSQERMAAAFDQPGVMAFDLYHHDLLIGFAMVRQYEDRAFFLWNYAIDHRYQNQHYGTAALRAFIQFMHQEYGLNVMATTYLWGNAHAKHVYETVGFVETDVIEEDGCHEVNMRYYFT